MLKKWLNLIFGCDGPKTIQTMQEWSQSRFDALFDENKTVELLEGITNDLEHQPHGKTNMNVMKNGIKYGCKICLPHRVFANYMSMYLHFSQGESTIAASTFPIIKETASFASDMS